MNSRLSFDQLADFILQRRAEQPIPAVAIFDLTPCLHGTRKQLGYNFAVMSYVIGESGGHSMRRGFIQGPKVGDLCHEMDF